MNILRIHNAPPEIRSLFLLDSDRVFSIEKIDTAFDLDWSTSMFNLIATHYNCEARRFYATGHEIGMPEYSTSRFFIQVC